MASTLRVNIVNTASLIYNHPYFSHDDDWVMSASHCFNEHLFPYEKYISTETWSCVTNELEFLMMIGEPKKSKGQLIPKPRTLFTFYDMPFDIQEKIYLTKHKLEMTNVLAQLKRRHGRYLAVVSKLNDLRIKLRNGRISYNTFYKAQLMTDKHLSKMPMKPFRFLRHPDISSLIDRSLSKPTNPTFAFSRLQKPGQYYFYHFHVTSKSACLMHLLKKDLMSLCDNNDITYNTRDTKKLLAKKLMSI